MQLLTIIIPVYNEEKTIEELLKRTKNAKTPGWRKSIIVVNDGSTDDSGKILKKLKRKYNFTPKKGSFLIINHKDNRGKGAAIKSAISLARRGLASVNAVLTQDADLEYDPADYKVLLRAFHPKKFPVVYGSRNLGNTNRGYWFAYLCGRALTEIHNLVYGSRLTDVHTGYKLVRADILGNCNLTVDGFDFCNELTAKILKMGHKIREVPINYYPRTFAEGKKVTAKDTLKDLITLLKYKFWYTTRS